MVGFSFTFLVNKAFPSKFNAVLSENSYFLSYLTRYHLFRSHLQRKNKQGVGESRGGGGDKDKMSF